MGELSGWAYVRNGWALPCNLKDGLLSRDCINTSWENQSPCGQQFSVLAVWLPGDTCPAFWSLRYVSLLAVLLTKGMCPPLESTLGCVHFCISTLFSVENTLESASG